jgi:HEAT repeats
MEGTHEQRLEARVEKGRLSVDVGAVPLVDLLKAIAEQTGAELLVHGNPGLVRPQAFTDEPLARGIRHVVEPNNLAMTFAPAKGLHAEPRLVSLAVYASTAHPLAEAKAEPVQRSSQSDPREERSNLPSMRDFARGGDEGLVKALSRALVRDRDALRQGAATGRAQPVAGQDPYRNALASEDPADRIEALHAMGEEPGDRAIGPLFEVLVGDEDAAARRTAVQILANIDSEDALAALEGALSDPDTSVRAAAEQALKR